MKFCSITPLKNADLMYENDYVMLLAHLSKKSENYRDLARNSNKYKIMDNSIIELGEAFTLNDLLKEAEECKVNEIILPDVFKDGYNTVKLVKESIEWMRKNNYLGKYKLMAVCHGNGSKEFFDTFCMLNDIPEVDVIGIPKINSLWMTNRLRWAESLTKQTNKEIHLLGCMHSLRELLDISPNSEIRSMDTCLPALTVIHNIGLFDDRNYRTIDLENDELKPEDVLAYQKLMFRIKTILGEKNKS